MGATVIPVTTGSATLKDACNEALRDWSGSYENAHYMLGTAAGPHPFPTIVREFQQMISAEAKVQILAREGRLPDTVIACVGGGSNAIGMFANFNGGLIFVPKSPRYIDPLKAQAVISTAKLNWVGVFQNEVTDIVVNIATSLNLFAVQLHGDEDPQYIEKLRKKLPKHCQIWQAMSIKGQIPAHNNPVVNRYLFDQGNGGTGHTFDWQLLVNQPLDNVILAGGINPYNAKEAIQTGAIGVDLNSGIETSPGIKDHDKIAQVFSILRNYPY